MGFEPPKYLQDYLNKEWRTPPQSFVNCSQYYANLDPYFMQYMRTVVRPCVAYATATADNTINSGIKMNVGHSIKNTAVKIVKGEKVMFEGTDKDSKILSDKWSPSVGFNSFYESAVDYLLSGGTCLVKLNKDIRGRCVPVAVRVDRYYATTDDCGNILRVIILNSFLFSESFGGKAERSYWLVEERFYENGKPYVRYKVNLKSGVAGSETLPTLEGDGIPFKNLPQTVQILLKDRNIRLNKASVLPFKNGLGCQIWRRTQTNSCVPGLAMGDPLLYGALDLLFAVDVVFSGSLTDVILGKGKVLVPKKYLDTIREDFKAMGLSNLQASKLSRTDMFNDSDDSLVYIYTERDKDFTPKEVQFDIRADKYQGMLEMYLRQIVSLCGFAPTSIFPFLIDGSQKTATEVTAEENLTRGTVQALHQTIAEKLNELIDEVLYQLYKDCGKETDYESGSVTVKLSDYIGNPLQRDKNIRDNLMAGIIPRKVAVQTVNQITASETDEYMAKIKADEKEKQRNEALSFGNKLFDETDYFGDTLQGSGVNASETIRL